MESKRTSNRTFTLKEKSDQENEMSYAATKPISPEPVSAPMYSSTWLALYRQLKLNREQNQTS